MSDLSDAVIACANLIIAREANTTDQELQRLRKVAQAAVTLVVADVGVIALPKHGPLYP